MSEKTIHITIDVNGILQSAIVVEATGDMSLGAEVTIVPTGNEQISFSENEIPQQIRDLLLFDHTQLIYSPEGIFKKRPLLQINITDGVKHWSTSNIPLCKINTPVKFEVVYYDPDDVGFDKLFDDILVTDVLNFVDVMTSVPFNTPIEIQSHFPGYSSIQAVDNKHLCSINAQQIQFIQ